MEYQPYLDGYDEFSLDEGRALVLNPQFWDMSDMTG
jgi:hypothetical protein